MPCLWRSSRVGRRDSRSRSSWAMRDISDSNAVITPTLFMLSHHTNTVNTTRKKSVSCTTAIHNDLLIGYHATINATFHLVMRFGIDRTVKEVEWHSCVHHDWVAPMTAVCMKYWDIHSHYALTGQQKRHSYVCFSGHKSSLSAG